MPDKKPFLSDDLPPACKFIRSVFVDSVQTAHDLDIIAAHTVECTQCAAAIGDMIYEHSKKSNQAEDAGT